MDKSTVAGRNLRTDQLMTDRVLQAQNASFRGRGGISEENRDVGFRPAFLDTRTDTIYVSRFADGRPAPIHLLDGLPDELVVERTVSGRVSAVRAEVISGFVRGGRFYTREEAGRHVAAIGWRGDNVGRQEENTDRQGQESGAISCA